jgi:alpha-beta hydrolase superfamily lysophospholipase
MPSLPFPAFSRRQFATEPYPRWGEEIPIGGTNGGEPVILRVLAARRPAARLLIVHGMNEYSGRYRDIAGHFAENYQVAGFDLPAHGLSNPVLRAADRAIRSGAPAYEVSDAFLAQVPLKSLEPMRRAFERALRYLANLDAGPESMPVFILAHSLGALVAASYLASPEADDALRRRIQGVILLGPAFSGPELPGWRGWFANPVIRLSAAAEQALSEPMQAPNTRTRLWAVPTARLLNGLFEGLSRPGFRNLATPQAPPWLPDYLTDWEEERRRHRTDAYIIRRSLLSYVKGIEREIARFHHRMAAFRLPYLLVYSECDMITSSAGAQRFAAVTQDCHPANRVMALAKHRYHEHLFCAPPGSTEIVASVDRWLTGRLRDKGYKR